MGVPVYYSFISGCQRSLLEFDSLVDTEASLALSAGHAKNALGVLLEAFVARENVLEIAELNEKHLLAVLVQLH